MATTSRLFMYSLTLKPSTSISQALAGHFSGTREQQILTASGGRLTLHRAEMRDGNFTPILSHDVFGIIRGLAGFRLAGSTKDYVVVSSDSGRIIVLEYKPETNQFHRIHQETFGKSGVRRVVPGQYLAADPRGRAVMLGAVEKNRIVYILNRNAQAELTISSPLEAYKPQTLMFALIGLDVGYDNPIFASLEVDVLDSDQDPTEESFNKIEKQLVYYELDLGLNHVVKKWADNVERSANLLLPVPGGTEGPSGVIVCGEESISYRNSNQDPQRVIIPRRRGATEDPDRKRHIVAGVMHKTKAAKSGFFFLLQTEDGDLFRLTIDLVTDASGAPTGLVKELSLQYFDTIPLTSSLVVLRSGFLFAVCESGDHQMYQFEKLGSNDPEITLSSSDYSSDWNAPYEPVYFHPRENENLNLIESINAMHPQMKSSIVNLTEDDTPQIYSLCGTGARSSMKVIKHGLEVSELVESELPSIPEAVWTIKKNANDEYDSYIVLSFRNGTLVLSIGETVEEVQDTGFLTSVGTIAVQLLGEDSMIQVYQRGVRHVLKGGQITDWPCPQHRTIVAAATNERQVAVALSSGELVYFELDSDGTLAEFEERREMTGTITALSIGDIPEGRQRSHFLAVGCDDSTVRILSLDPESTLEHMSVQALTAAPSSLRLMSMVDSTSGNSTLYLHMGLWSGVYIRTVVDDITGQLSDTRPRFLGPKPVKLFRATVKGRDSLVALSSRPWLIYNEPTTLNIMLTPILYNSLEYASNFSSEECPEGMVGIEENRLRIFNVTKINSNLFTDSIPLTYTPRYFSRHPQLPYFYIAESDANILSTATKIRLQNDPSVTNGDAAVLPPETFGYPKGQGHWASCIQVVDPVQEKKAVFTIDLDNNEAATAIAAVSFASQDGDVFIVVATGKDMTSSPPSHQGGYLHVYSIEDSGKSLSLLHKTKTDVPCRALIPFQGRVLAGIGKTLRLFDIGQRQLLRKAQGIVAPNQIVSLQTQGSRIVVSDVRESVTFCVFKPADNLFIPFADDSLARWSTTATMVDYETAAGGDKFGNFWMLRCPDAASREADEDETGAALLTERGYLQGTAHRLDMVAHYFTQDIPTSMQKTQLVSGGRDVLLWTGLQGTIGLMIPFVSREDVDFFISLEQHMRTHDPPLAGRDHLAYRGYYVPPKGVIDGDLCERFFSLSTEKKMVVAAEMERSVRELERKLGDIRARVAF